MIERRQFSRVIYQVPTEISQGQVNVSGSVQDLSLHGLLIQCEELQQLNQENPVHVSFKLTNSDINIQLEATIVSTINTSMRLRIEHLDIDSISHLKRLVELNVGDDDLLYREIEHLTDLGKE
ncbi:PilZ domain-containing protein [Vibrio sp. IB15]|uniref:Cyclic diguanosine monophosphate-binding protein n=1 Tax=Vibrio chagasii TaxID=170679 RepID=A0A7V7NRF0_9VIBR|nr:MULTISPECIES: PilZ domain-containing protein [Vibrio]KAB0476639.1 PilZ domain-containing protein [Vibrio chagasii]MBJ2147878.1 PilZ domain-containing protein [Vibrio sp. IB15]MCG9674885.1 PilZ domain-containing protein [Vibrio chagasii]MDA0152504.1 PilZ domain-containing protein [Vibrio sp. Makdt]CAH6793929.1 Cyclic diguanosine monophosphate-binding protein [Vibrio chagasii]